MSDDGMTPTVLRLEVGKIAAIPDNQVGQFDDSYVYAVISKSSVSYTQTNLLR